MYLKDYNFPEVLELFATKPTMFYPFLRNGSYIVECPGKSTCEECPFRAEDCLLQSEDILTDQQLEVLKPLYPEHFL